MNRVLIFVFFVQIIFLKNVNAQGFMRPGNTQTSQGAQSVQVNTDNTGWNLPPLQTVIDYALEHSPLLKLASVDIQVQQYEVKEMTREWMRYVMFTADTRYGSMFDFARMFGIPNGDDPLPGGNPVPNSSKELILNYGVGLTAYMPISNILDQKRKKQLSKLKVEQVKIRKDETVNQVTQMVIESYYDVLSAQKTMSMQNELSLSASVVHDKAKLDFTQNRISLEEYSKANETNLQAQNRAELQKITFLKALRNLELIVGVEL